MTTVTLDNAASVAVQEIAADRGLEPGEALEEAIGTQLTIARALKDGASILIVRKDGSTTQLDFKKP